MNRSLPQGLVAYRRTPIFTETTLPAGLRKRHQTKPGVWAQITVIEGRLRFRRLDSGEEIVIEPSVTAIVEPEEPHEVEPLGSVRFFIEFHAEPHETTIPSVD